MTTFKKTDVAPPIPSTPPQILATAKGTPPAVLSTTGLGTGGGAGLGQGEPNALYGVIRLTAGVGASLTGSVVLSWGSTPTNFVAVPDGAWAVLGVSTAGFQTTVNWTAVAPLIPGTVYRVRYAQGAAGAVPVEAEYPSPPEGTDWSYPADPHPVNR